MKKPLFYIILFMLFFPAKSFCYAKAAEHPSFAATGLLTHPEESAEEILGRAHRLDLAAIALVVSGYSMGIGGFPEMSSVADAWVDIAAIVGEPEDVGFIAMLNNHWSRDKINSAAVLADCDLAQTSRLVASFQQGHIFDLGARLNKLSEYRNDSSEWQAAYRARQTEIKRQVEYFREMEVFVRELSSRPATQGELERLKRYMDSDLSPLLYFAGLEYTQDVRGAWSASHCLKFVGMRLADPDSGKGTVAQNIPVWYALGASLNDNPAPTLDLIRQAHGGNMPARRSMAQNYLVLGYFGPALLNADLATAWMIENVKQGDGKSRLQTALYLYYGGDIDLAWALTAPDEEKIGEEERAFNQTLRHLLETDSRFSRKKALELRAEYFDNLD